jgi:RNA recognition motif-containing protein
VLATAHSYTLYVGGIGHDADVGALRSLFEGFGEIASVRIVCDGRTAQCRGFGYVSFEEPRAAIDAQLALDGRSLDGKRLRVTPAL